MSPMRPSLSIEMPAHFEVPLNDTMPKTPDQHREAQSVTEPPLPPKQTYKVKRRPRVSAPLGEDSNARGHIIPTIEMSEALDALPGLSSPVMQTTPSVHGLLAPVQSFQRGITPPKTPAPRLHTAFEPVESPAQEWDLITNSRSKKPAFERAGSIGSTFSDSSISSAGSSAFSAPCNGSLSPDSETTDPFMEDELHKDQMLTSPNLLNTSPCAKRVKTRRVPRWTPEMDDHLWMTYMQYISDPTLTPFKMLPGTAPPLGVCCRVAAKAKRTWKDQRATSVGPLDAMLASPSHREGSPDTIRPESQTINREAKQPQWPRSEGATRRRLRHLCKRKPSLSAHYQRLLRTRSPSPFHSSSSAGRSSEPPSAPVFSGSDMKMSLIAATNPSMQPDGPLAQLTSDQMAPRPQSQRDNRPADWFARIPRSQAHQKSLSLQSGLGLHTRSLQSIPMLASPFDERSHLLQSMANTKSLGRNAFNLAEPTLDSPFEVRGAPTAPRSLKRRFRPDEDKSRRPAVQDIFSSSDANPIVRNRGFTVGATTASDNLSKLFTPPTTNMPPPPPVPTPSSNQDSEMTDSLPIPEVSMLGPPGSRSAPRRLAEPVPRLGSPFMETVASRRQHNTFPRSYIPSEANPQPFQQRLKELAVQHEATQQTP